jgi:tetratricopeptide (TPR) repeat protein
MESDLVRMAETMYANGKFQKAISLCEEQILRDPNGDSGYYTLSKLYFDLEKYDLVRIHCQKLLALKPDHFPALKLLCRAYIRLRNIEEAEAILWQLKSLRNYDREIGELARKCEVVKENFFTETYADLLLSQGNVSKSFNIYKNAYRRKPNHQLLKKMQKVREILFLKRLSEKFQMSGRK